MRKTALSGLASICALAIPLSVAAEDSNFEIYGDVEVRSVDRDDVDLDTFVDTARLGLKGLQLLPKAQGIKLRWQLEFDLPKNSLATDGEDSNDVGTRKAQVNLQGGFGEFILGRQNNLLASTKKLDTFRNDSGVFLIGPDRVGNAISYVSPSAGGIKGFLQIVSDADAESTPETEDGVVINENEDVDATIVGLEFSLANFSGTLGRYEVDDSFPSGEVELNSLGVSVALGSFEIFSTYQDETIEDIEVFGIGAAFNTSNWTYKLGVTTFENDTANTEGTATHLIAIRDLGNSSNVFIQYVDYDSDAESDGNGDALSVGIATSISKLFTY